MAAASKVKSRAQKKRSPESAFSVIEEAAPLEVEDPASRQGDESSSDPLAKQDEG